MAAWLQANPDGTIALVGHTDASGSLAANTALSERRAEACLLYTSDAADERSSVDLGGRRIIKKKYTTPHKIARRTKIKGKKST